MATFRAASRTRAAPPEQVVHELRVDLHGLVTRSARETGRDLGALVRRTRQEMAREQRDVLAAGLEPSIS